ncbi:enoyl-CoA hydratase/isomerase family protein [Emcibacter sp.]|uniref:enoyl-CoA hydratase/isomerase family protein n=1 Tax=Emcibacter sp. TaxID=1979954 RepID=UPI002AA78A7F|nr:enoyl-CoA hydratase/isomerase family protein [Emcibacter sp.]
MNSESEILFEVKGRLGCVLLNRPKALNALSTDMCARMNKQLDLWATDDNIAAVVVEGAGEKAFCAGGDVRTLAENGPDNSGPAEEFFATEYQMNARIFHFPKPYISFLDGITMGGGVGISVHGSHCIVTEKTMFAMPETGIGLVPDVGGSYFLPRLPGRLGYYIGLTGARLRAADCLYTGIGTAFVPTDRLEALKVELAAAALSSADDVDGIIARFAEDAGEVPLDEFRDLIDAAFGEQTLEYICDHLEAIDHPWAGETLATLQRMSPTSLKVTLQQLLQGAGKAFDDCMRMEYRLVNHLVTYQSDFFEGIRAVLIDRDNSPKWSPASLREVCEEDVMKHFEPLGDRELNLQKFNNPGD